MLSEHENDYIRNVARDRINQINLKFDQIKINAPLNKNIQPSRSSWRDRYATETKKCICIIS